MEKKSFYLTSVLVSGLCAAVLWASDVFRKPANEPFRDRESGIVFPARLDTFEKVMVRINPDPRYGTDIAYENEFGALADVYIYRLTAADRKEAVSEKEFSDHAKETSEKILTIPRNSEVIRKVEAVSVDPIPFKGDIFCGTYRILLKEETLVSQVYLFRKENQIIRIRMTYPAEQQGGAEAAGTFRDGIFALAGVKMKSN